jgi:hypothetical protein
MVVAKTKERRVPGILPQVVRPAVGGGQVE